MLKVKSIPEKTGYYLTGFADAQSRFSVSFYRDKSWQISLSFEVIHHDKVMLALFKRHLKCGTLRSKNDEVWHYEVTNLNAINENVIPFFKRFGFLSAENKGKFSKFKQVASLLQAEVLTQEALQEILQLRRQLDQDKGEAITDSEILDAIILGKSSETTRQATVNSG